MLEKFKNKKAFTLIEIIAVIVILGILLFIGVIAISNQSEKASKKTFFVSVSNIVRAIKTNEILSEKDYCIYDYSKDENNKTSGIKSMYVLVHKDMEINKIIYSVYATSDGNNIDIDLYDFSKASINDFSSWKKEQEDELSYTYYLTSLFGDINESELAQYKKCDLK